MWFAVAGVDIHMIGLTLFDAMATYAKLSNGFYSGKFTEFFMVVLSDGDDPVVAGGRIPTGWIVLNLSLSRLSAVFAVATGGEDHYQDVLLLSKNQTSLSMVVPLNISIFDPMDVHQAFWSP